MLRYSQI